MACLPSLLAFCSIIISWSLLVLGRVPWLVSLVFWHSVPSSFPASLWSDILFHHHYSWFHLVVGRVRAIFLAFCSIIMSWFPLVPGRVPGLVSLIFWHSVPSSFPGSGACLPSLLAFCSIIWSIIWSVIWLLVGFRGLFPYSFGILIFWFLLVPGWGSGACPPSFVFFQEGGDQ